MPKNQKLGYFLLILSGIFALIAVLSIGPVVQDDAYHNFADQRNILSIPNFWDVISNLPFLLGGIYAFATIKRMPENAWLYYCLFFGFFVISFGSAYYHWAPDSNTLFWDRLPMTIVFMSLFSIVISEFISVKRGHQLFLPLLFSGVISVLLWRYGSSGDLRLYGIIQFYPMIALPIIVFFFPAKYTKTNAYWYLLFAYMVAKVLEHFDNEVYELTGLLSGHSLKHLVSAVGLIILIEAYRTRTIKS